MPKRYGNFLPLDNLEISLNCFMSCRYVVIYENKKFRAKYFYLNFLKICYITIGTILNFQVLLENIVRKFVPKDILASIAPGNVRVFMANVILRQVSVSVSLDIAGNSAAIYVRIRRTASTVQIYATVLVARYVIQSMAAAHVLLHTLDQS